MVRNVFFLWTAFIFAFGGQPVATVWADKFLGPFVGWLDAKRDFGAVGDGKADDTAALQRALAALIDDDDKTGSLYLPAGTYRITGTLSLPRHAKREAIGLNIQGEDPERTILRWDGPAGGVMFEFNAWYSQLGRITFDGAKKAESGLTQSKDFVTANEMTDLVFQDLAFGIRAGLKTVGIAETTVLRSRFLRCSEAGFSCEDWNSLDWWFRGCKFEDCKRGVTNDFGSGNFHCYECDFARSTHADISMLNTGYLSFRHNYSKGSRVFFLAGPVGSAAAITLQGNTIVETTDPASIQVGNLGPVLLLDNTIISRADQAAGPVLVGEQAGLISVGNSFTVKEPLKAREGWLSVDDQTIARPDTLPAAPVLPGTPPKTTARVWEIAADSDAASIQKAIDEAAAANEGGIVHLPFGEFKLSQTLTVPAGKKVCIVGEGIPYRTRVTWVGEGDGPAIRLPGPSLAMLSNFALIGPPAKATGLLIDHCDQPGTRVLFDQAHVAGAANDGWRIENIENAQVYFADIGHSDSGVGMRVVGGENQRAGKPVAGRVVILAGASSSNKICYEIQGGARLLARDIWYETTSFPRFVRFGSDSAGEFVLNGSNVAHPRKAAEPGWEIDGFRGQVTLLAMLFTQVGGDENQAAMRLGDMGGTKLTLLGCHGSGEFMPGNTEATGTVRIAGSTYTAGGGAERLPDINRPLATNEALLNSLSLAREPHRQLNLPTIPAGATNVVVHRIFVRHFQTGIIVEGE